MLGFSMNNVQNMEVTYVVSIIQDSDSRTPIYKVLTRENGCFDRRGKDSLSRLPPRDSA